MTCDHAVNVNCNARQATDTDTTSNNVKTEDWLEDIENSVGGESFEPTFQVRDGVPLSDSLSSEKIAIIVLVFILLAVCLAISFCFRERIKEVARPYLDQLGGDKLKTGSPSSLSSLGLLRPYSFRKHVWTNPASASNKTAGMMKYSSPVSLQPSLPPSAPSVLAVRELPPVPILTSGVPVPPPRRKKSVVEIQTGLCQESDNTQSVA